MPSFQSDAVAKIAMRHPAMRIVLCHLLAPHLGDDLPLAEALKKLSLNNIWFDLAALPWNVHPETYPYPQAQHFLATAKQIVGAEKLIWGSDVPCTLTRESYARQSSYIGESAIFSDNELEKIFCHNAEDAYSL
jgi:predicted TIM-barrel fold metal-dependent hydrolase